MPGRWNDERERDWQDWRSESDWRARGRDDEDRQRWRAGEPRSFGGERDYGAEYGRPRRYAGGYRGPRFEPQDYTRGGRYYGDDARDRIYREEYGLGGYDYGPAPRGYDEGRRFGSRDADERWAREMHRTASGGTGGYDYERGYGDGGREESRRAYEERAREAGDFFRRTGQRISNWFSDVRRDMDYRDDERRYEAYRGARGLGPKGYKRSDERISDDVHQRLTDDPWVDASDITVSVASGEVALSGTVDSREAKHRAERIVEDLSGVTHVQNNLRIRHGGYFTSAGRGYGDSAQEARMASSEPVSDATDGDSPRTRRM